MNKRNDINLEEVSKVIETLETHRKQHNIKKFKVSYFGGEPLLNWNKLKELDSYFVSHGDCYERSMPSNLLALTDEIKEYILKYQLRVSWSFDGVGTIFSRLNNNHMYKSVYQMYLNNYQYYLDIASKIHMTIDDTNIHKLVESYDLFSKEFKLPVFGFTYVKDNIWNEHHVEVYRQQMNSIMHKYIQDIKHGKTFVFENFWRPMFNTYKQTDHYGCEELENNQFICIYPDGTLYPCARFGTNNDKTTFILTEPPFEKCNTCKYKGICNSNCICNYLVKTHKQSPYVCDFFDIDMQCYLFIKHELLERTHNETYLDIYKNNIHNYTKLQEA
jgi:uncharacterized protein